MAIDVTPFAHIPTAEVQADLQESLNDVKTCQLALAAGVTSYSGGSVQGRLDTNLRMIEIIRAILLSRGENN